MLGLIGSGDGQTLFCKYGYSTYQSITGSVRIEVLVALENSDI